MYFIVLNLSSMDILHYVRIIEFFWISIGISFLQNWLFFSHILARKRATLHALISVPTRLGKFLLGCNSQQRTIRGQALPDGRHMQSIFYQGMRVGALRSLPACLESLVAPRIDQ